VRTKGGRRYFVTYICGKTRYAWVFLLKRKSEQASVFKNLVTNILPKFGGKVKKLYSNNGGEYMAKDFVLFRHRNGIETLHTSAHPPEQNDICKRFHRTLVEALRTVLLTSRIARTFWGEFIISITYVRIHLLYNFLPDNMSSMEAAFETVPDVSWYRTLGFVCYTMLDIEGQDKRLIKANPSTLLRYSMESLSYRVLIWCTGRVAYSRNVIFDEEYITNGAMSGVANPFIKPNQQYKDSVDTMLNPRLELLKETDDEPDSDDEETSDRTVGLVPVKF
jgi:Integrase core domain